MAEEKRGITVEFYGKTQNLTDSISDINKGLKVTRAELTDFKNQLKIDPKNLDALNGKLKKLQQEEILLTEKAEYFRKELKKLGEEEVGGKQWQSYNDNLKIAEKQLKSVTEQIKKMEQADLSNVSDSAKEMSDGFKGASDGAISLGDIIKGNLISDAIISGIKTLANEIKEVANELNQWAGDFRKAQVYEKQFESNIRNTADATDDEIKALKNLAKQKQREGVISARAITSAYQELATYVESTDAIEGLTDALTDMAAQQYGVDATDESVRNLATTLGKALANGDYSGLTRLGYGFDETQKYIMKYGDELERVAVLNEVIESSIGGMNEALAQTDAGQLFQIQSYFDGIKQSVGEVVSELQLEFIQGIMPEIQTLVDELLVWIIDHKEELKEMVKSVVDWLTSEETKQFFKDVAQIVIDLATIIEDVVKLADKMGILTFVWNEFKGVVDAVKTILDNIVSDIEYITSHGLWSWLNSGTDYSGLYGEPNSWDAGWSGGYGALNSGGHNITLNPTFNVTTPFAPTRMDLRQWSQWMLDDINDGLGRAI
jgi:hypothetical protein